MLSKRVAGEAQELDCQGTAEQAPSIRSTQWSDKMTVVLNFHGRYS